MRSRITYTSSVTFGSFCRHLIILAFLAITFAAFLLTMLRIKIPLPERLVLFSYGMIAPYQGYERVNAGLMATGQKPTGEWESINLDPYFPVLRGERKIREFNLIYRVRDDTAEHAAALRTADTLLRLEKERGHRYTALRLYWDQWTPSPAGYNANAFPANYSNPIVTIHE